MDLDQIAFIRLLCPQDNGPVPRALTENQLIARKRLIHAIETKEITFEKVSTCLCGNSEFVKIASRDGFGLDIGADLCKGCGLIVANPAISGASIATYYSKYHNDLWHKVSLDEFKGVVGRGEKIFDLLKDHLPRKKDLSVLDVGGGVGNVAREFSECAFRNDWDVHPVLLDYSVNIKNLTQMIRNVEIEVGGLEDLHTRNKKFDVVIMSHVVEHFKNPLLQFQLLKKHITPETLVYVEVPGIYNNELTYRGVFDLAQWLVFCHLYHFNLASLSFVLAEGGYRLIWGNECVEAIFRLGEVKFDIRKNAEEVLAHLKALERNLPLHTKIKHIDILSKELKVLEKKIEAIQVRSGKMEKNILDNMHAIRRIRNFPLIRLLLSIQKKDKKIRIGD